MDRNEAKTTFDHDTIRRWVEERDGAPATVAGTEGRGDAAGILRFDFSGGVDEDELTRISWDEWFDKFEKESLALIYQDGEISSEPSTFFKIVGR